MKKLLILLAAVAVTSQAGLVTTHTDDSTAGATVDGTINANEYGAGNAFSYAGGGTGFGGSLGGSTLYMNSDSTTLYIGFDNLGNPGTDQFLIYFNTQSGGYSTEMTDANGMDDLSDNGRANMTRLASGANSIERVPFDADYALLFNRSFSFSAQLADTGPHSSVTHTVGGLNSATPEFSFLLADLGLTSGDTVQFSAYLISDSGFLSNEGVPPTGQASNPGFNTDNTVNFADYDAFETVPEPGTLAFACIGLVGIGARFLRRRSA